MEEAVFKLIFEVDFAPEETAKIIAKENQSYEAWLSLWAIVKFAVGKPEIEIEFAEQLEAKEQEEKTLKLDIEDEVFQKLATENERSLAWALLKQALRLNEPALEPFIEISKEGISLVGMVETYPKLARFNPNEGLDWSALREQIFCDFEAAYLALISSPAEAKEAAKVEVRELTNSLKVGIAQAANIYQAGFVFAAGVEVAVLFNNKGWVRIYRHPRLPDLNLTPVIQRLRLEEARERHYFIKKEDQIAFELSGFWYRSKDGSVLGSMKPDSDPNVLTKLSKERIIEIVCQALSVYGKGQVANWKRS